MRTGVQVDGHKKPYPTQRRRGIFRRFGLPEDTEKHYPFQLSGGMARRVLVSTALITDARLIIADEPTPGMSLGQALEALKMFREMANDGKAIVLITHDIDLAFAFADRIAVFYAGTTVETASAQDFQHKVENQQSAQNHFVVMHAKAPYCTGGATLLALSGNLPKGCLFAPRCSCSTQKCTQEVPPMQSLRGGEVRCFYAE